MVLVLVNISMKVSPWDVLDVVWLDSTRPAGFAKREPSPPEPLKKKLHLDIAPDAIPRVYGQLVQEGILAAKQQQRDLEGELRKKNLQRWRDQVNDPTLKGMSRWVRKKETVHTSVDIRDTGCTATCPGEAAQMIHNYWDQLWTTQQIDVPSVAQKLVSDYGFVPPKQNWKLSLKDVWIAIRAAHGAAGTDGWTGEEIRHLPYEAIVVFHKLTQQWEATGNVPRQLLESRQVNIPKSHKIGSDHSCKVENLRPISVLNIWWRTYASAWTKGEQVRGWAREHLHKDVAYGAGAVGAEALTDLLQTKFVSSPQGYLATMDWSQAFDRVNAEATIRALRDLNFCPPLTDVLQQVWLKQRRYVCYENSVCPKVLHPKGIPQGCPLSPLILAIWVSSGLNSVQTQIGNNPNLKAQYVCYMDDRSFWGSNIDCVTANIASWNEWTKDMGLKENPTKTEVTARGKRCKQDLFHRHPEWSRDSIKILGASTISGPRKNTPHEDSRLRAAKTRAAIIGTSHVPWKQHVKAHQYLVVSKGSYGWLGRDPPKACTEPLFNQLSRSTRANHGASRDLRKLWYGATTDLRAAIVIQRWSRIRRNREKLLWNNKPWTSLTLLRKNLKNLGFIEQAPWLWRAACPHVKAQEGALDLRRTSNHIQDLDLQKHNIREAFRRCHFKKFVASNRRDARCVRDNSAPQNIEKEFIQLDTSMAMYGDLRDGKCPFCPENGTLRHILWCCPQNPPRSVPASVLGWRMGWVTQPYWHNHVCKTIRSIWDSRHNLSFDNHPRDDGIG